MRKKAFSFSRGSCVKSDTFCTYNTYIMESRKSVLKVSVDYSTKDKKIMSWGKVRRCDTYLCLKLAESTLVTAAITHENLLLVVQLQLLVISVE